MRALGWVFFALTCAFCALQTVFLIASGEALTSYDVFIGEAFPLATIGSIAGAAVGALIVSRYPRNVIGWLFCLGQLGNSIGSAASAAIFAAQHGSGAGDDGSAVKLVAELFNASYTMAFLALIFLLVPNGRLPSRRWRFAPAVPIAACVIQVGVFEAIPESGFVDDSQPGLAITIIVFALLAALALALSITLGAIAIWRRLRASTGEQRQQLRWIAASAAALTVSFIVVTFAQFFFAPAAWYLVVPWYLSYIFVSVAVGVSILKYRLYDIDVILSRAVVLAILAVFVTVGYVGVVVAIGAVLSAVGAPGSTLYWPSLVATALVATAFQPLRRYVLQLADQFVYGNRAVPYEALAALSRRLADNPSAETLPARVAEATGRAIGARRTLVRLGRPGDGAANPVASWPADAATDAPTDATHRARQHGDLSGAGHGRTDRQHRGHHGTGEGAADVRATTAHRCRRSGRGGLPQCPAGGRTCGQSRPDQVQIGGAGRVPAPTGRRRGRGPRATGRRDPARGRPAFGGGRIGHQIRS